MSQYYIPEITYDASKPYYGVVYDFIFTADGDGHKAGKTPKWTVVRAFRAFKDAESAKDWASTRACALDLWDYRTPDKPAFSVWGNVDFEAVREDLEREKPRIYFKYADGVIQE